MSRRVAPPLVWENDDDADRAGTYSIRLESPSQWRLEDGATTIGTYTTRTAARNAAVRLHVRREIRRRLGVYLLIGAVSLIVLVLALAQRTEPNPDFPPARAQADRLDAARIAVEAGDLAIEQVSSQYEGLAGGSFDYLGARLGIVGLFDGDCYGVTWRPGFPPSGVAIRSNFVTCEPDASLINQPDPPGLTAELMWPTWEDALPDDERSPVWFLPTFILAFGAFFSSLVRGTALMLQFRR